MKLLNRLTVKGLRLNRKRTAVTIVGVLLSAAMITTVSILVSSARESLINYAIEQDGKYHYVFEDADGEQIEHVKENRQIESWYAIQQVGYAPLKESRNEGKPYLRILALDPQAFADASLELTEGRMPETDSEVVIAKHIRTNGGVDYRVGDTIDLDIGERTDAQGNGGITGEYFPDEEKLVTKMHRNYKIVGVIERPGMMLEPFSEAGYSVLTCLGNDAYHGKLDIYAYYTKEGLKNREQVTDALETALNCSVVITNESLLRYQVFAFSDSNMRMLLRVAAVVLAIIMFSSIFCIRNSFAISITEKMQQYGMLASVGATSRQIRKNVFFEATVLALIGIPLGVGSGLLASAILIWICNRFLAEGLFIHLVYAVSLLPILAAILLSYVTILISARRSARCAASVSPIEAIRGNTDVEIKAKKVRSPGWIKRLFGIGGELADKNLRRSRKKYRTTVISIVVSVSLFIAMSSFIQLAFGTLNIYYKDWSYNLAFGLIEPERESELEQALDGNELVKEYAVIHGSGFTIPKEAVRFGKEQTELYHSEAGEEGYSIMVLSLGDQEYARYLKALGLSEQEVEGKAVLYDYATVYAENENGEEVYQRLRNFAYEAGDVLPLKQADTDEQGNPVMLELAAVTDQKPLGMDNYDTFLVVSDKTYQEIAGKMEIGGSYCVNASDAGKLEAEIRKEFETDLSRVTNLEEKAKGEQAFYMIFAIFLYGFIGVISLIGITNIFNTITTNMELRSREFAMLKSIGMTKKEFARMIRLETLFYGGKSLLIGIPIGLVLSYLIYRAFAAGADFGYPLPWSGILIAAVAVFLLIAGIMRYSMNKINRQNIIETIRKNL